MKIIDFRYGNNVQVKVENKWYNLIAFQNGKYGIKKSVPKAFNPYFIFNEAETKKIIQYLE